MDKIPPLVLIYGVSHPMRLAIVGEKAWENGPHKNHGGQHANQDKNLN